MISNINFPPISSSRIEQQSHKTNLLFAPPAATHFEHQSIELSFSLIVTNLSCEIGDSYKFYGFPHSESVQVIQIGQIF